MLLYGIIDVLLRKHKATHCFLDMKSLLLFFEQSDTKREKKISRKIYCCYMETQRDPLAIDEQKDKTSIPSPQRAVAASNLGSQQ